VVGDKFKGVKMLPPGPHFLSWNSVARHGDGGDFAPTIGHFWHLSPRQVVVQRWEPQEELLLPIQDADEVRNRSGLCVCVKACLQVNFHGRAVLREPSMRCSGSFLPLDAAPVQLDYEAALRMLFVPSHDRSHGKHLQLLGMYQDSWSMLREWI
jgi:hypothetical protein